MSDQMGMVVRRQIPSMADRKVNLLNQASELSVRKVNWERLGVGRTENRIKEVFFLSRAESRR